MSDLVLRGLLLPESRTQVTSTSNVNNSNSILKGLQLDDSNDTAQSLNMADHLKLSENTTSSRTSKGSVPIQLMNPGEITSSKPQPVNSKFQSLLTGLQPSTRPSKPSNVNNTDNAGSKPKLTGLQTAPTYNATATVKYTQTGNNTTVTGNYSVKYNTGNIGVAMMGKTGEVLSINTKISEAIEKIKTWDRKIGILDAEINKQSASGNVDNDKIISRTSQTINAKKDAVASRSEALRAYSQVLDELKGIDLNATEFSQTKNLYLTMESNFSAASAKDKTMMEKVSGFLKSTMTVENFNRALGYLNPFN